MKLTRRARGLWLEEGGDLVSVLLHSPGPTHELFDILAALLAASAPGPRVLLLGFAAGGVIAPLRAMGWRRRVDAVDLDLDGHALYREHAADWGGPLGFHHAEAGAWLRSSRRRWDLVLDDLSVPGRGGHVKPPLSLGELPQLVRRRLAPHGVSLCNLLPDPERGWRGLLEPLTRPWRHTIEVRCEDFENRLLVSADRLPSARELARALRERLRAIGSEQATRVELRRLR